MDFRLAAVAVQKVEDGDQLSAEEIAAGIEVLNVVLPALFEMGERYRLTYLDLGRSRAS
jgi:hypothetical protein